MTRLSICNSIPIQRTDRVKAVERIFDMSAKELSEVHFDCELRIDDKAWNVGLIVGPSGSGKTTIAKYLFERVSHNYDWPEDQSVLDGFSECLDVDTIVETISRVGFNSPPNWLRPFRALSTGEKFRVTAARAILEEIDPVVIDEFTSVVDRTVAKIGSCAVARTIRRKNKRFVAVSCHYDIIDWLQPDWVLDTASMSFQWRCLRRRPEINLVVRRVSRDAWQMFRLHHYLSATLNRSAQCFGGFIDGCMVAFCAMMSFPHAYSPGWKITRIVCLPDYQGVGISSSLLNFIASIYASTGKPVYISTSHPTFVRTLSNSNNWTMVRKLGKNPPSKSNHNGMRSYNSTNRLSAGFKYIGHYNSDVYAEFVEDRQINRFLPAT